MVIPAHNEEARLGRALASVSDAIERSRCSGEIVVVANRCSDRTEIIAREAGAIVVRHDGRNIAATRNVGVAAAIGEVVVTLDADNVMHPRALVEVDRLIRVGRYVGGGCSFVPERRSTGIAVSCGLVRAMTFVTCLGGVMYWCRRSDFDAIGGFDESRSVAEDLDFAYRLRRHGRADGRRFRNLKGVPAIVCCRKFDTFGDWHILRLAGRFGEVRASLTGTDTRFADAYFYDYDYDRGATPG